jgi:DNA-binding MarR family transcriptional regulator
MLLHTQHEESWLLLQQPRSRKSPGDAVQAAWVALQRTAPLLQEAVETKLKAAGLPDLSVYSVLWAIERAGGPIRPRDLGLTLFLPRYRVSRLIDAMVEQALVAKQKCPNDLRGHHLALTDKGKALRTQMWAVYGPAMAEAMHGLMANEAETLTRLLDKLAAGVVRDEEAACGQDGPCGEDG